MDSERHKEFCETQKDFMTFQGVLGFQGVSGGFMGALVGFGEVLVSLWKFKILQSIYDGF